MSSLPKGWVESTLGNLVIVERGSSPRPIKNFLTDSDDGINWIKIGDAQKGKKLITSTAEKITKEGALKSRFVDVGDFILSNSMSFGRPYIMGISGCIHDGWFVFRLPKQINSDYFYYLLSSSYVNDQFNNLAVGGVVKNISGDLVKKAQLPLPPLAEQKRIVEKLDEVLAQVDTIKARLDGIPSLLKRFRQSVLASAVSGKLTEEWRGEHTGLSNPLSEIFEFKGKLIKSGELKASKQNLPLDFDKPMTTLPINWEWSRFISLCTLITDGKHGNCNDEDNSGYYFLSAKDVKDGELIYNNARQINKREFDEVHQRTNLQVDDICLVNTGATVGKLAIVKNKELACKTTFQKSVAVLKVIKPYVNNKFISYFLLDANKRLLDSSTGSAVNNLLLSTIKQMCVPVPPVEEQKEIVRLVDQYFAFADTIEAQVKKAQARVNNLTQSILAKAFRGELVPQDPNDEPADKLLERIAQARIEAETLAKAAKKAETARKKAEKATAKG